MELSTSAEGTLGTGHLLKGEGGAGANRGRVIFCVTQKGGLSKFGHMHWGGSHIFLLQYNNNNNKTMKQ